MCSKNQMTPHKNHEFYTIIFAKVELESGWVFTTTQQVLETLKSCMLLYSNVNT